MTDCTRDLVVQCGAQGISNNASECMTILAVILAHIIRQAFPIQTKNVQIRCLTRLFPFHETKLSRAFKSAASSDCSTRSAVPSPYCSSCY